MRMLKTLAVALVSVTLLAGSLMAGGLAHEVTKPTGWFTQAAIDGEIVRLVTPEVAELAKSDIEGSNFTYVAVAELDIYDPTVVVAAYQELYPEERFFARSGIGGSECSLDGPRDPDAGGACFNDDGVAGTLGSNGKQRITW